MLKSNLCHYSDAYILVKGNITVTGLNSSCSSKTNGQKG